MILLLFTASFPFDKDAEQTFLQIELKYLQQNFDRVILVPRRNQGKQLPLPTGIEVDLSYADALKGIHPLSAIRNTFFTSQFYHELISLPWLIRYPRALKRLLAFLIGAQMTSSWVQDWFEHNRTDAAACLFYTYWFDHAAYGIGLAKKRHPHLKLVSRVHGYDLYEEYYYQPPYWPRRRAALGLVDRLFPDSRAGLAYLNDRYPDFSSIYETALLGVQDPGFTTPASPDEVFRIVSCSMLEPVKRVDLIMKGVLEAAKSRPDLRFEWHHFGNGENRQSLQENANRLLPPNAKGFLPGYSTKEDLMNYYEHNPVDVFINLSASEGTPVSVMEAISCGIPVIATSVGGNVEIVLEKNGLLLDSNPTPEQVGTALLSFWEDRDIASRKRQGSRDIWGKRYDADSNFRAFAKDLKAIRQN